MQRRNREVTLNLTLLDWEWELAFEDLFGDGKLLTKSEPTQKLFRAIALARNNLPLRTCPGILQCSKLCVIWDKDFTLDEMYTEACERVCKSCEHYPERTLAKKEGVGE